MKKISVGVLGATGMVGQRFLSLLLDHPWFEVSVVAASDRSAGKTLGEAGRWLIGGEMPAQYAKMIVQPVDRVGDVGVVFSALPGEVAGETEIAWARSGAIVFSNAGAHRRDPLVPLLVPEVNPDHIDLLELQRRHYGWSGGILTNPNCTTTHAVLPMRPLHDAFGLRKVLLVSMQAISGAGYPGVSSLDIIDNVVPLIGGEEGEGDAGAGEIVRQLNMGFGGARRQYGGHAIARTNFRDASAEDAQERPGSGRAHGIISGMDDAEVSTAMGRNRSVEAEAVHSEIELVAAGIEADIEHRRIRQPAPC